MYFDYCSTKVGINASNTQIQATRKYFKTLFILSLFYCCALNGNICSMSIRWRVKH